MATTFDARRIPTQVVAGDARGNENAVSIAFFPKTQEESNALFQALYAMEEEGMFKIETTPAPRARGKVA